MPTAEAVRLDITSSSHPLTKKLENYLLTKLEAFYEFHTPNPLERDEAIRRITGLAESHAAPLQKTAKLLSVEEACELLGGITRQTLYQFRLKGKIKAVKVGPRLVKIHPAEIERFMAEGVEKSEVANV